MEILIGGLAFGLVGLVAFSFVFMADDAKRARAEGVRKVQTVELEAQLHGKDEELRKALSASRHLEEEFAQAKGDVDAVRKELSGLMAYVEQAQKAQEELAKAVQELKEKDEALELETAARHKLQQDLAHRDTKVAEQEGQLADARKLLEAGAGVDAGLQGRVAGLEAELGRKEEEIRKASEEVARLGDSLKKDASALEQEAAARRKGEGDLAQARAQLEEKAKELREAKEEFARFRDDLKAEAGADEALKERVAGLESQMVQKEEKLAKALAESSRFEEAYYQAKHDVDIARKECSELTNRLRQAERSKGELAQIRAKRPVPGPPKPPPATQAQTETPTA